MPREGQHSGISDDTRARAKRFAENAGMPKPAVTGRAIPKQRVVSKKELEESGLSLRDFLNRERGLTRRGMSKAEAEKQLGMGQKPTEAEVASAKEQLGLKSGEDTAEYSDMTFKRGGKVKTSSASKRADGIAIRGKTRA